MTATADDPIRAEVERVLHAAVDATLAAPVWLRSAVPRCVRRRAQGLAPLAEPWRMARALFDLVGMSGSGTSSSVPPGAEGDPGPASSVVAERPADVLVPEVRPVGDHLPIEDYESLAASQVVDRLLTLTAAELEVVRAFEATHRGRRTVLGRIEQLLA